MKKIGKKGRAWIKARAKLIKEAITEGRIEQTEGHIKGICEDCKQWKHLAPDHKLSRGRGGGHEKENIDWICDECHRKRDQQGDPMKKKKNNKPDWVKTHACKSCKVTTRQLICHSCGRKSIK